MSVSGKTGILAMNFTVSLLYKILQYHESEILPHWRFKTVSQAQESASTIYEMFEQYLAQGDFVGADMARKFLQMGFTRSRRYANHPSGR